MKKENLELLAQGYALIAKAYQDEAKQLDGAESAVKASTKAPKNTAPTKEVEEAVEETTEEEGYSLSELKAMTLKELKEIADENEIEYGSKVKKDDLIDLIMDAVADEDVSEETDNEPEEDTDEEGISLDDLEAMTLKELKELADENEIEYPKGVKAPKLREIIAEYLDSDDEEEEEETGGDEEGISAEELEEMSLKELKELADENGIEYPKVVAAKKLREIILEAIESGDEDDSTDLDEGDIAEELGLNDMETEELAEILTEAGIKATGKKQALIARIVKAVEDGEIEVGEGE